MELYHIEVPPPLPGTSSRQALRAENMMLRDIIVQAGIALEEDYAQMKLMDLENERLRKRAFQKEKQKTQNTRSSGHGTTHDSCRKPGLACLTGLGESDERCTERGGTTVQSLEEEHS
jgi:hypothetical protein